MLNKNVRIDLHIHTAKSRDRDVANIIKDSTVENMGKLIEKLAENKIDLISFTDHNVFSYEYFREFKGKALSNHINIIPGTELNLSFIPEKDSEGQMNVYFNAINDDDYERIERVLEEEVHSKIAKEGSLSFEQFIDVMRKINLSIIMIPPQSHNLANIKPDGTPIIGGDSFSDYSGEVPEKTFRYIDALEFKDPKIEGILKNDIESYNIGRAALITGSDCHDWNCYPYHDESEYLEKEKVFTELKADPSFDGLLISLSSPKTRLNRSINDNENYVKSIVINDSEVILDKSVNVFIGDNGSGKTTIFSFLADEKLEKHNKKIIDANKVKKISNASTKILIKQNEYVSKENAIEELFRAHERELIIDNTKFEDSVNAVYKNIVNGIHSRIILNEARQKIVDSSLIVLYFDMETINHRHISIEEIHNNVQEKYKKKQTELERILGVLDTILGGLKSLLKIEVFQKNENHKKNYKRSNNHHGRA